MKKVILVLVDGMRPDAMKECGNPYFGELIRKSSYCLNTQTTFPSVTLPCHFSLFYSVPPERHGICTNVFTPMVRPLPGIFEQLKNAGKHNGMFFNWAELRDISRPGNYDVAFYAEKRTPETDNDITDMAIKEIRKGNLDFAFVYMGYTDSMGHSYGWMTNKYLEAVSNALDNIRKISNAFPDYNIIITADHGGHERMHGENIPEDMTTPLICMGDEFEKNHVIKNASIMDIAPSIMEILDVQPCGEWDGKSFIKR